MGLAAASPLIGGGSPIRSNAIDARRPCSNGRAARLRDPTGRAQSSREAASGDVHAASRMWSQLPRRSNSAGLK